jgi:hypothetical protein
VELSTDLMLQAERSRPRSRFAVPLCADRTHRESGKKTMAASTYDAKLAYDDFRAKRFYMPADAFALVTGPYEGTTDLIQKEQWQELMNLPTDVLLRTSDQHGSQLGQLNGLWSRWVGILPTEPKRAPFMFNVGWDAAEDFNFSVFSAMHGYYRQAMASLRSALEGLTLAASYAQRDNEAGLNAWLSGEQEPPKFGNARDALAPILGAEVVSVLRKLYKELSGYIHSGPGGSNAELWGGSNGPVFEPSSFQKVYRCFRDVMAMGYVLLAVGWPRFSIPEYILPLFETPDGEWGDGARAAVRESFVN